MKTKNFFCNKIWNKYNYVLIFLVILTVFLIINGSATTWVSLMNIPRHSAVIGIIALSMGLIILTGDIDLSVGSQLALIVGHYRRSPFRSELGPSAYDFRIPWLDCRS